MPLNDEQMNNIDDIIKDIAKQMKEVHDMSTKCRDYAELFYQTKRELENMDKRCVEIEDKVKNYLGRAILLSMSNNQKENNNK